MGLLANLGKAKARNYYLDLTCSFIDRSVTTFLTKLQDVGEYQFAKRSWKPCTSDGGQWVANSEDIFTGRKEVI